MTAEKRIYLGGVRSDTTEAEIQDRFKAFGVVSHVEFPVLKNCCFFSFESTAENLKKCLKVYTGTKWKGNLIKIQEAKLKYDIKLEIEQQEQALIDSKIKTVPVLTKKKLKKMACQHASNMTLVTKQRKGWVNCKQNRLVARIKMRFPVTGRETLVDPLKYQANWTRLTMDDLNVSVTALNFVNGSAEGLQDLSKDSIRDTTDNGRKRAGIWTAEELLQAKKLRKQYIEDNHVLMRKIAKSTLSKKQYFINVDQEERLQDEKSNAKSLAQKLGKYIGSRGDSKAGIVDFLSDDEEAAGEVPLKLAAENAALFDSEDDEELEVDGQLASGGASKSLQDKMALFDDSD